MKPETVFGLENAAWPALLVDDNSTILRANQAAVKMFGPALEGQTTLLAAIWSPENGTTAEQFLAQWERLARSSVSLKFHVKGGTSVTYTTSICAWLKDEQKTFVFQLLPDAVSDDEATGQGADTTTIQKQKLDCALQLARTVALDFNNALTSILGYTSLLLSKAEPDHPWRRSLLEVEKSAAKAAEVANELAAFSRQEKEIHSQPVGNLNTILERCVEVFQRLPTPGVDWKLRLERQPFAVRFDEAKIQQAFLKIIENAVEALPGRGSVTIQSRNVVLASQTQDRNVRLTAGTYVCIEISDDGHGIEPDELPRIFEPFFTTKRSPHRGLGLALVYGIITNHGGGVAVSSHPGMGTSVRLYLPSTKKFVKTSAPPDEDLSGKGIILMVDDEDLLLTMGETVLGEYGYQVLTANSGQKALEILSKAKTPVDLVITDLVMPAMGGRELVERIGQLSPATRIICTSGYVWPQGQQEEAGYLQKPFTSQDLLLKVKQALAAAPTGVD